MPAQWARATCAALLGVIGAVFVLKYSARVHASLAWPAALAFAPVYLAVLGGVSRLSRRMSERAAGRLATGLAALLLVAGAAAAIVAPDVTRVARAPAVAMWLDALTAGAFPYCSRILPSGLPGLFLLLAPFHAIGAAAWVPFAGVVLFVVLTWHVVPDARARALPLAAMLAVPSLHYEGLVGSELFLNGTLAIAATAVAERSRIGAMPTTGWAAGAFAGLVASTRLVVPLALVVYLSFAVRRAPRVAALAGAVAAAVFLALAAPFVAWDAARFFACGPLAVQGLYLPLAVPIIALGGAMILGWTAPDLGAVMARTGMLVFALVAIAFAWKAGGVGAGSALWGDEFDVSYFVLATPFLALALAGASEEGIGPGREQNRGSEVEAPSGKVHFPLPTSPTSHRP